MTVCIIDVWSTEDPALMNSHWVAERTAEVFERAVPQIDYVIVGGSDVDAESIAAALACPHHGFAYFGQGCADSLFREPDYFRRPIVLIGRSQLDQLTARWFHAFACLSGQTLCRAAAETGAAAYLGYVDAVNVEWNASLLPHDLRVLLADLVTVATLQLATGERSRDALRRRVRAAADRLIDRLCAYDDAVYDGAAALPLADRMGLQALDEGVDRGHRGAAVFQRVRTSKPRALRAAT